MALQLSISKEQLQVLEPFLGTLGASKKVEGQPGCENAVSNIKPQYKPKECTCLASAYKWKDCKPSKAQAQKRCMGMLINNGG